MHIVKRWAEINIHGIHLQSMLKSAIVFAIIFLNCSSPVEIIWLEIYHQMIVQKFQCMNAATGCADQ